MRYKMNQEIITTKIKKIQLKWYSHMIKMEHKTLIKNVLEARNIDKKNEEILEKNLKRWNEGNGMKKERLVDIKRNRKLQIKQKNANWYKTTSQDHFECGMNLKNNIKQK